ncbi:MAG: hypothetical protein Q4C70_08845 [Planctomycetia bacterium]|nr:hypothetical protein [Planctomycetia bacterium]
MLFHKIAIPNRFLFRIEMPCYYRENLDALKELPPSYTFPDIELLENGDKSQETGVFSSPRSGSGSDGKSFQIRGAWNEKGIAFQFFVSGKTKTLWCSPHRPDESDRIELWLDTRNVHNVHRATRYCHRLICLAEGMGDKGTEPTVISLPINRAKQLPNEIPQGAIQVKSHVQRNCYSLFVYLSANALTGYDPTEFQDIGLTWALIDRDFPMKTLSAGAPFPFMEDPSLWYTIHLEQKEN